MQDRLLSMIYILMNKGTVTAAELAERFEVSVRTVYRDVETLSMAGIPVYARKGKNGGISITREFVLDKMLVTRQEQTWILAALESLKETGALREEEILLKLGDFFQAKPLNWVSIDFSDWSGSRTELYGQIRESIISHKMLIFDYYGQYGEMTHREVEPMQLLFREYTWYLRAFCRLRQEMRLFKVLRMKRVQMPGESFAPRREEYCPDFPDHVRADPDREDAESSRGKESPAQREENREDIVLWVDRREAWRIYDRFEEEQITVLADGNFLIQMNCLTDDWVYGMILSFGPSARVLEPETVRAEIRSRIRAMVRAYEDGQ